MLARTVLFLMIIALPAVGQEPNTAGADSEGFLEIRHEHQGWPPPELLVQRLRSSDDVVRTNAFTLFGLNLKQADMAVAPPDKVQLSYAALGADTTQDAVVALELTDHILAAVAVPTRRGWERIAVFDCWCKYDMKGDRDTLMESVQLRYAPEYAASSPFELVLRASGGGTGLYEQQEGHFRLYRGELRRVMSFISRRETCDPTARTPYQCDIEKRWFYTTSFGNVEGGVLVESRGSFAPHTTPSVQWEVRDIENRHLRPATCHAFRWNRDKFQYEPITVSDPCKTTKE